MTLTASAQHMVPGGEVCLHRGHFLVWMRLTFKRMPMPEFSAAMDELLAKAPKGRPGVS